MDLARLLCAGVDLWINTPEPPHEASGTSGMKAALNGVPQLGVLDGWWMEGHVEGVTGWSVGSAGSPEVDSRLDADDLYRELASVAALFQGDDGAFVRTMRHCIALNGSFFNAQRMLEQYVESAYEIQPERCALQGRAEVPAQ